MSRNNQKLEFLEIYNSKGLGTGLKESKYHIHKKGLHHITVHLWLFTGKRNVLIQKRSKNKELNPGVWDVSVAGHVHFKENIKNALIREAFEETGMIIIKKKLIKLGIYSSINYHKNIIDREFNHTYLLKIKENEINLDYSNEEVDELKLISLKEMKTLLKKKSSDFFVGKNENYYQDVFNTIDKLTTKNFV